MEFRVIRYFLAVAREENITKAAEKLHLTQPTLSRQLRELEEELGIKADPGKLKFIGMHDGTMEAVFDGKPFKNHELSAVYIYDEPVKDSDFKLQEEEVESVRWIDFDECKNKLWTGEIRNCIFESEFKMLEKAIRG